MWRLIMTDSSSCNKLKTRTSLVEPSNTWTPTSKANSHNNEWTTNKNNRILPTTHNKATLQPTQPFSSNYLTNLQASNSINHHNSSMLKSPTSSNNPTWVNLKQLLGKILTEFLSGKSGSVEFLNFAIRITCISWCQSLVSLKIWKSSPSSLSSSSRWFNRQLWLLKEPKEFTWCSVTLKDSRLSSLIIHEERTLLEIITNTTAKVHSFQSFTWDFLLSHQQSLTLNWWKVFVKNLALSLILIWERATITTPDHSFCSLLTTWSLHSGPKGNWTGEEICLVTKESR